METNSNGMSRPVRRRGGRRRRISHAICAAAAAAVVLAACENREQKPKVSGNSTFGIISVAAAQQVDLVVPPAAISGVLAAVDEAFALFAASSGLAEIEAAQLVLKSSNRSEVRDYAQKLAREHGRALDELRRLVAPRGLKLPTAPTGRHADLVTKLAGVQASDRDDAFLLRFGVDAHKETIALFERHASEGRDPDLKRYAQQNLSMLREHMASAYKLLHAYGGTR